MTRWGSITIEIDFIDNPDQAPVYTGILRQMEHFQTVKKPTMKGSNNNGSGSGESVMAEGPSTPVLWKQVCNTLSHTNTPLPSHTPILPPVIPFMHPLTLYYLLTSFLWHQGRLKITFILADPIVTNGQEDGMSEQRQGLAQGQGQGLGQESKADQENDDVDMSLPLDTFVQVVHPLHQPPTPTSTPLTPPTFTPLHPLSSTLLPPLIYAYLSPIYQSSYVPVCLIYTNPHTSLLAGGETPLPPLICAYLSHIY